ncbi:MAG: isoprenylcysteine carboxylmethyltransferase family protein, partial [Gemmatimonadales bacterium]
PFNPPTELVVEGPYVWTRNPMLTGVFTALFGVGVLLHSVGMVLISIPAYILVHVIHLKLVEEPELERRFGTSYSEYRGRVPMFWPHLRRGMTRRAG